VEELMAIVTALSFIRHSNTISRHYF